ncbi:MAG: ATP-binding protein [Candidatus Omnitrophica bacterium]|nr:ATP-binding protein [Candidatus Omnitrophota bacterium]
MSDISKEALIEKVLSIPAEDRVTEFKRLGSDFNVVKVCESIVAMANTDGGIVILGVDDPEKSKLKGLDRVYGIEENLEKYDELGRYVQKITPPISYLWPPPLRLCCANNKTIAVLSISKAINSFHSIDNHVFIRLEKGNRMG